MNDKVENMVAGHIESVHFVVQRKCQLRDNSTFIRVLRTGDLMNIPNSGIIDDAAGIIKDEGDMECVRINQSAQDDYNQDMDNRFPEKILRLDSLLRHPVGAFSVIRFFSF